MFITFPPTTSLMSVCSDSDFNPEINLTSIINLIKIQNNLTFLSQLSPTGLVKLQSFSRITTIHVTCFGFTIVSFYFSYMHIYRQAALNYEELTHV